jgi:hypothetical protein
MSRQTASCLTLNLHMNTEYTEETNYVASFFMFARPRFKLLHTALPQLYRSLRSSSMQRSNGQVSVLQYLWWLWVSLCKRSLELPLHWNLSLAVILTMLKDLSCNSLHLVLLLWLLAMVMATLESLNRLWPDCHCCEGLQAWTQLFYCPAYGSVLIEVLDMSKVLFCLAQSGHHFSCLCQLDTVTKV